MARKKPKEQPAQHEVEVDGKRGTYEVDEDQIFVRYKSLVRDTWVRSDAPYECVPLAEGMLRDMILEDETR